LAGVGVGQRLGLRRQTWHAAGKKPAGGVLESTRH